MFQTVKITGLADELLPFNNSEVSFSSTPSLFLCLSLSIYLSFTHTRILTLFVTSTHQHIVLISLSVSKSIQSAVFSNFIYLYFCLHYKFVNHTRRTNTKPSEHLPLFSVQFLRTALLVAAGQHQNCINQVVAKSGLGSQINLPSSL